MPWTVLYREGSRTVAQPIGGRAEALDAAMLLMTLGRRVIALRSGDAILDPMEIERLYRRAVLKRQEQAETPAEARTGYPEAVRLLQPIPDATRR